MDTAGQAALKVGIAGLGAAGQAFVPALRKHTGFDWVAAADPVAVLREQVAGRHGVAAYGSLDELLAHPGLDAVCIATPTALHAAQAQQAAAAGKHVLVEKPMAVSLADGQAMIDAARRAGTVLVVGHSHGHDLPIRAMRELIDSGELGAVRMVNTWCFTDWVLRPRRADELDDAQGGGVTFRQGSHQFDIARLLCGGLARSVRAKVFDWQPQRRGTGAHMVFIDFDNGAAATAIYNGYGGLSSMDLCFDISEWGFHQPRDARPHLAPATAATDADALRAKQARAGSAIQSDAPFQPFFGLTVVSCEGGDIRQSPRGLLVHTSAGLREIALPLDHSPRDLVLAEWHDAIAGRAAAVHDGAWGMANLEVCLSALASSQGGHEVRLHHQVAVDHWTTAAAKGLPQEAAA